MKKILSLVLALVMVLGLSVPVLATESDGTWSYDPNTNTFTVNCTIPKKETLNTAIPEEVSITSTDEITGITGLAALWVKTSVENGYLYGSRNWIPAINKDDPNAVFKANTEYGYLIVVAYNPSVLQKDLSAAKIDLNGKEYSNVGNAKISDEYAEMFIAVDFGTLDENGNFIGGDFSEPITSGITTITANVVKPDVEYEIVIPSAVTMNEAGVKEIGAASIDTSAGKLKNATANTVISYTAEGTNFKLSTNESTTMAATYYTAYTDASTNTVLDSSKAIEVYKNSALVNPLTKLYVGVSKTDWDNAAKTNPGTYTATVTYNFSAEEVENMTTVTIYCNEGTIAGLQESYTYPQGTAFTINGAVLTIGTDTFTVTPNSEYPNVLWVTNQVEGGSGVKNATGTLKGDSAYFNPSCYPDV